MKVALLLSMVFFAGLAFAVSSQEAVDFVVKEKSFVDFSEKFEHPLVPITQQGKKYWVIPVVSGDTVLTFFPVKESVKDLSVSRAVNRELFATADILREFSLQKQAISKNTSVEWIFTQPYSLRFSNLSNVLRDESLQLNIIYSALPSDEVLDITSELSGILDSMSLTSGKISVSINEAVSAENDFFSQPGYQKARDLKEKYEMAIENISVLNDSALKYRSKLDSLKQTISFSSIRDPSEKNYLISLADVPPEFNNIGNYLLDSLELSSAIDSVYSRVSSRTDLLLNEFDLRLEKEEAFSLIFGKSKEVDEKTLGEFSSLPELVNFIMVEENKPRWKAGLLVNGLEGKWKSTQTLFSEKNYALAQSFAEKSMVDAINIYRQGFVEQEKPLQASNEVFFQAAGVLFVLLVGLLLYNNRDKLVHFGGKNGDGKGVFSSEVD